MTRLNRSTRFALLFCVSLGLVGAACESEKPSGTLRTDQISAFMSVVADASGSTVVEAALRTGNPRADDEPESFFPTPSNFDVRLSGGDRLFAKRLASETQGGMSRKMKTDKSVSSPRYVRTFKGDEEGRRYRIAFSRKKEGRKKARESYVTLPAAFELDWVDDPIALTPAPIPFSRSSSTPYYVVWDPFDAPDFEPGDVLSFSVTGTCIQSRSGLLDWEDLEDVLELTNVLQDAGPPNDAASCPINVRLTLTRRGSLDSGFRGGNIVATQLREIELDTVP